MNKRLQMWRGLALVLGLCALLFGGPAWAQATRTWVSGVGNDANPCSRTAPCATLAAALANTVAGGEIDILDPGVFDGSLTGSASTVTINQPVTIDGGGGQVGAMGGISGADSLVINLTTPSAGGVILRNLSFNGYGVGNNGIHLSSATNLVLENVDVTGYSSNCLLIDPGAASALIDISNSTFSNCAVGVANQTSALVNLGDSSTFLNTTLGVSSNNSQGGVLFFNTVNQNNAQNTSFVSYSSGTSASLSGGAGGCAFSSQQFVIPATIANGSLPSGVTAAGAGFQFTTNNSCGPGNTVTITVNYAQAFPAGTVLYKYGPATPGATTSTWFQVPGATFGNGGTSVTFSITDNGVGDSNPTPGVITDPVVPVLPPSVGIPTLSPWALVCLALGLGLLTVWSRRRTRA